MRACNHHDRDHPFKRERKVGPQNGEPGDKRDQSATYRDECEPQSGPIGQILRFRLALLSGLNKPDDLGNEGLATCFLDLDGDGAVSIDRSPDDRRTRLLRDRFRFPREHRFVDERLANNDFPVGGDSFARLDEHAVARGEIVEFHLDNRAVGENFVCRCRQYPCHFFQGIRCPHDRFHLDPVAQEHQVNQSCQFPKED